MAYISYLATLLCFVGTVLNIKKMKLCFVMWLLGNVIWFLIDIQTNTISRAILDITQLMFNLWGIFEWRKSK